MLCNIHLGKVGVLHGLKPAERAQELIVVFRVIV